MTATASSRSTRSRPQLAAALDARTLAARRIGELRHRESPGVPGGYLSNGCIECDALIGRFHLEDLLHEHLIGGGTYPQLDIGVPVELPLGVRRAPVRPAPRLSRPRRAPVTPMPAVRAVPLGLRTATVRRDLRTACRCGNLTRVSGWFQVRGASGRPPWSFDVV